MYEHTEVYHAHALRIFYIYKNNTKLTFYPCNRVNTKKIALARVNTSQAAFDIKTVTVLFN